MVRENREAAKQAEGKRFTKRRKPSQKAPSAQLGTIPMLHERKEGRSPVMEKCIKAESSEEEENSVFADPLEAKSMPSCKSSSGSDTEREEETHELEFAQTLSTIQKDPIAVEAQETPKQVLESLW